ncbi:MAG: DUF501 domain-containing protein [Coriobacteriia bacterium]|nr:DUF501 domain-containing protein [Coriobacteriia bacterium]
MSGRDDVLVRSQIGRAPRRPWRVAVRCRFGYPQVIATPSVLEDGSPFPTLYWLTCPYLARAASDQESAGGVAREAGVLAADRALATAMRAADAVYRTRRAEESGGSDACEDVGIAGQRDPLATKCLHAHAAAALAGVVDPVGRRVLRPCGACCEDDECAALRHPRPWGAR